MDRKNATSINLLSNYVSHNLRRNKHVRHLKWTLFVLQFFKLTRPIKATFELSEDFFSGCSGLNELVIHNAALGTLPAGLFKDATKLRKLDLRSNAIQSLPNDLLAPAKNLDTLILKDNLMAELNLHLNRLIYTTNFPRLIFICL